VERSLGWVPSLELPALRHRTARWVAHRPGPHAGVGGAGRAGRYLRPRRHLRPWRPWSLV